MKDSRVFVMGSYVTDMIARTKRLPTPGETVLGQKFQTGAGGKGSNQATAIARLGGEVTLVTKLGDDEFGQMAINHFTKEKIDISYVTITKAFSTGSALIAVDEQSENMIVVTLGACNHIKRDEIIEAEKKLEESDIVLTQLETNLEAVDVTIQLAEKYQKPLILNPAPYQKISKEWLPKVDYITPNETEVTELTQIAIDSIEDVQMAAKALYEMGPSNVIITLGKKGSFLYNDEYKGILFESFPVEARDTTGAGDAFNGGLAYALANQYSLAEAIEFGNAVGALAVTKEGTAQSMPSLEDVERFLQKYE